MHAPSSPSTSARAGSSAWNTTLPASTTVPHLGDSYSSPLLSKVTSSRKPPHTSPPGWAQPSASGRTTPFVGPLFSPWWVESPKRFVYILISRTCERDLLAVILADANNEHVIK